MNCQVTKSHRERRRHTVSCQRRDVLENAALRWRWGGRSEQAKHRGFSFFSQRILYAVVTMDIRRYPLVQTHRMRNPEVNYGLCRFMMSQYRFRLGNKRIALVGMLVMGEGRHPWGREVYGASPYLPLNFIINLKLL